MSDDLIPPENTSVINLQDKRNKQTKSKQTNGSGAHELEYIEPQVTDTDMANAKRLYNRYGSDLKFTDKGGWFVWDGRRWASDEKEVAMQARAKDTALAIFDELKHCKTKDSQKSLYKHGCKSQAKGAIAAMIWLTRSEPGVHLPLTDFDQYKWLFNVANGTIDLQTMQFRAHAQDDLISNISEIEYNPAASCEQWDEFVMSVCNQDEGLYKYLQRLTGYLLVGDVSDQSLHFLYGLGANGKSVFCDILIKLLGDYANVVSPEILMTKRTGSIPNDIARLRGVRAVFANETAQHSRFDEAKLKELTGGDKLTGRFLRQESFDFYPTHRIIIRGNHKPTIDGTDEGIWRRLRLLPFNLQIPIEKRDAHLAEKLSTELPGILNWALKGCQEWHAHSSLLPPPSVLAAVAEYREESDTIGRFIEECCEIGDKAFQVKASSLYIAYQEYCKTSGERWIKKQDFPHELLRRNFQREKKNFGWLFYGLRLPLKEDFQGSF